MRFTPLKMVVAMTCAICVGSYGTYLFQTHSSAPPSGNTVSTVSSHYIPADHGFNLAEGSDPMLMKVSDMNSSDRLKSELSTQHMTPSIGGKPNFADIVESSSPSVVQVRVQKHAEVSEDADDEGSLLDFLRKFGTPNAPGLKSNPKSAPQEINPKDESDDDFQNPMPQLQKKAPSESAPKIPFPKPPAKPPLSGGVGSGFFIDKDGYILTNAHVVEGAEKIILRLSDHSEIDAKLIGLDKRTDIALIKAEGQNFKPLPIGSPDKLRVGEWVLAIGSPFGLEFTATAGIVSAKARALPSDDNYIPFLQTDAAVNPGNSGGPLINERGQAIGINSQIYSRSGGYMGISFAIPIDYAVKIAGKLRKKGSIEHGRIGAYLQDMTPDLAKAFGMVGKTGAIVLSVEPDSAADHAGIKASDIVLAIDGKSIAGSSEMVRLIADSDPGDKLILGVTRKGEIMTFPVTLGGSAKVDLRDAPKNADQPNEKKEPPHSSLLGMKVRPLNERECKKAKITMGLKVIESAGLSEEAGIEVGDILLSVDGQNLNSVADFAQIIAKTPAGKPLAILLKRAEITRYIAITPY